MNSKIISHLSLHLAKYAAMSGPLKVPTGKPQAAVLGMGNKGVGIGSTSAGLNKIPGVSFGPLGGGGTGAFASPATNLASAGRSMSGGAMTNGVGMMARPVTPGAPLKLRVNGGSKMGG